MLSLCGDAGALGKARDALGDRSAELVQGHVLAGLAAFGNTVEPGHAIMVGAVDRSLSSSPVSGAVTPGRSGAAASWSGEASRRSSPSVTALTPSTRMGCAVHRGEEEMPHVDAGRTRRCTIAVAVIIVTSVGVQSMRTPEQRSATAT